MAVGRNGFAALVEVKDGEKSPSKRKLTEDEEKFAARWFGPYVLCNSPQECAELLDAEYRNAGLIFQVLAYRGESP